MAPSSILHYIAGEPQKLDSQKYMSVKIQFPETLRGIGKTLSSLEVTIMHLNEMNLVLQFLTNFKLF